MNMKTKIPDLIKVKLILLDVVVSNNYDMLTEKMSY